MNHFVRFSIPSLVLALCAGTPQSAAAQSTSEQSVVIDASATVEILSGSNDVTVQAGADRRLLIRRDNDAVVSVSGGGRAVRVDANPVRGRSGGDLRIDVPRGTTVLLRGQNGDITVRGLGADVEIRTTSGDITVDDAARLRVETISGDITGRNISDGVRISATSGDVSLNSVTGDVEINGTSSTVVLRDVTSRRVHVKVVSGDVQWSGDFSAQGRYEFNAHSGDITLQVPRNARALLDVQTFNGSVSTRDLPITLLPDPVANERELTREREREELRRKRDSVRQALADSVRESRSANPPRSSRDSATWERSLERNITSLVENVLRGISVELESLSVRFDGAGPGTRARRYQVGDEGGPIVTVSTFNGDIVIAVDNGARRR